MKNKFSNNSGATILKKIVKGIQENKDFLGEVDGFIGDGDHGMNMNKGFTLFEKRFLSEDLSFSKGLNELGMILLNEIGGSMGPIYGTVFIDMADAIDEENKDNIGLQEFALYLEAGLKGLQDIVEAKVGDKTLIDTLVPAVVSLKNDSEKGSDFTEALKNMREAAEKGRDSTKDMVARFGRSSRLGERSRGVLDAGACSCYIVLEKMAEGITELLSL